MPKHPTLSSRAWRRKPTKKNPTRISFERISSSIWEAETMATVEQPKPQANSRPTRAQPAAVIRYIPGQDGDPDRWRRLLPAWIISFVIHICRVLLFLVLNFKLNADTIVPEDQVIETQVDTEVKPPNLENDEVGMDPDLPTNYNVSRIEDVSVPGPV